MSKNNWYNKQAKLNDEAYKIFLNKLGQGQMIKDIF